VIYYLVLNYNLVVFFYLSATEIWPSKRDSLILLYHKFSSLTLPNNGTNNMYLKIF
jgi:hypothetical protein